MSMSPRISAPQGDARVPKRFQTEIINGISLALQRDTRPPCLLRSPTGSGKTYMLTKVLQRISSQQPTLWLWFVPYVTLVAQTIDALVTEGTGSSARELVVALNEEPAAGLVLLSTVQGVASAKARSSGYTEANDDTYRSIAPYLARARSAGLQIGLVVDEAHIALKSTTEFGQFAHWVNADYFLMASATPRDAALNAFIDKAGYGAIETFTTSRDDVVQARLNKRWIQAVVYNLRDSMQSVTDLDMTVLRRAWRCNQKIERELRALGLATVPLMLVQVANGDEAIREAFYFLTKDLNISPDAIGMHEAADPDPKMMAAIANDTRRQVLIFKQSAGTGFDAPRAFVLASTKHVNDADFATQFIGRIMRVPYELQQAFPDSARVPPSLDTAFVFLANPESQPGFAEAALAIKGVKSQLSGQTEELYFRRTAHGGVAMTNRPTDQTPLAYNLGLLRTQAPDGTTREPEAAVDIAVTSTPLNRIEPGSNLGLFETQAPDGDDDLDTLLLEDDVGGASAKSGPAKRALRATPKAPANREELFAALEEADVRALPRRAQLASNTVPSRFMTEVQPMFEVLALDVNEAARRLSIDDNTRTNALRAALNRMTEKEIRTELFGGEVFEEDVQVITDQDALLDHTRDALARLGLEDQDATDVIQTLAMRLIDSVEQAWALQDDDARPSAAAMRSQARQAACWVVHKQFPELQETLHSQWANRAKLDFAQALPDALLLPATVTVLSSRKNIYGVLYPSMGVIAAARETLAPEARRLLKNETYLYGESAEVVSLACVDGSYEFNDGELKFAKALDLADFVEWWHRNPHSKPFSVGLLRGDSKNLFYPDFVVCMTHMPGDSPLMRLIDPKHDTKDAARKAIHTSSYYGKVLFLTKDASRFKIVNDDGSVGDVVDFDNLSRLKTWMRATQPAPQSQSVSV
jgi:type III restriction enzyme